MDTNGVIPIIKQITTDIELLIADITTTHSSVSDQKQIQDKLLQNMKLLKNLGSKVDKTSKLVQSVISSINSSRTELKKSVEGLIQKTGAQLGKITSTTEDATNKILDVAEKLDDDQMQILDKLDELQKEYKIPKNIVDEIRVTVQGNQDKAFTIMDYLQFQDITAQQIAGAYALLSDTENTLVYVSELLREFDDLAKEEKLITNKKIDDNSFNADAKFENKQFLQDSIDDLFKTGNASVEFPKETAEELKKPDIATTKTEDSISQVEIDNLTSGNVIMQDDIDNLFKK